MEVIRVSSPNVLRRSGWLVPLALFPIALFPQASKNITTQRLVWAGYLGSCTFNDRWSVTLDVQERLFIDPAVQHVALFRPGVHRALGSGWDVAAGMSVFLQRTNDPDVTDGPAVPELRPHFEFNENTRAGKLRWNHRLRAEARYFHGVRDNELADGFAFGNFRVRYRLGMDVPLRRSTDGTRELLTLRLSDEVMFNAGRSIVYNIFDQNRIGAALQMPVHARCNLEAGYIHWFQQRASGSDLLVRHIFRLTLVHRIDLRKPTAPSGA